MTKITKKRKYRRKKGFKLAEAVSFMDALGKKEDFDERLFCFVMDKCLEVRERAISHHK